VCCYRSSRSKAYVVSVIQSPVSSTLCHWPGDYSQRQESRPILQMTIQGDDRGTILGTIACDLYVTHEYSPLPQRNPDPSPPYCALHRFSGRAVCWIPGSVPGFLEACKGLRRDRKLEYFVIIVPLQTQQRPRTSVL
jgi:hypothetical protein